jgi:uncharacterized protein (DUF58 family)
VEFGGFRAYAHGDDLRWLDRRSLLLYDRLIVRQFETETDRALRLVVDATSSMGYRGPRAPGAKIAFAAVLAAALARIAILGGDPVSLTLIGGTGGRPIPPSAGREQFERVLAALESTRPEGDARRDGGLLERSLDQLARGARRGSVVVLFSDLVDLGDAAIERVAPLGARGRVLVVVQVLDPDEADFPFTGTVRLRAMEGDAVVETEGDQARAAYLDALAQKKEAWTRALLPRDARLVTTVTTDDPVRTVRRILESIR